jgi:hypothetical protein
LGVVPVVRLTEVFQQAAASRIIINAHRINQGAMPDLSTPAGDSDFYFVPAEDPKPQFCALYAGITRGKRLVALVGQTKAVAIAVRNLSGRRRWSKLDERLRLGAPSRRHIEPQSILPFNDRSLSPTGAMPPLLAKNQRSPWP